MSQMVDKPRRVFPERLTAFAIEAMVRSGLREEDARIGAEVLVTTDTFGVHTHGTKQLRPLMRALRTGQLDAKASPEIVRHGTAWALIDGHYALPMVTSCFAMQTAIEKARTAGIAYAGVRHSSHFGAAGYYANMAVREDMIGISMCNVDVCMTVPGGKAKMLGTNPIAFAFPSGQEKPVFLDIATSAVAASKIFAARDLGKRIPDNWLVDDEGVPTTDPTIFPQSGAMLPMAGHKGYGLALLVEVLAAVLTGADMTTQVQSWLVAGDKPTNQGHAFVAINVGAIMPIDLFRERMDWVVGNIKEAPKANGSDRIYLPGEMEWERREGALSQGMTLPADVIASLDGLAQDVGLDVGAIYGR